MTGVLLQGLRLPVADALGVALLDVLIRRADLATAPGARLGVSAGILRGRGAGRADRAPRADNDLETQEVNLACHQNETGPSDRGRAS